MQYLAGMETGVGDFCQGVVHFPGTSRLQTYYPARWFETMRRLSRAHAGVPGCQVSLRTSLRAGRLEQLALFRAPAVEEDLLRHYITSYLGLLALVPDSVALPMDAAGHDALAQVWADQLCRIPALTYRHLPGREWFVCDFHVQDILPPLLEEADAAGHDFLHQINFQTWDLSNDDVRKAAFNLVALRGLRGPSEKMIELQSRVLHRRAGEVVLVSEDVGSRSEAGATWLKRALERHFSRRYGPLRFDSPDFVFRAETMGGKSPEAEEMAYGFHPALIEAPTLDQLFASAAEVEAINDAFDWERNLSRWFQPPLAAEQAAVRHEYEKYEEEERKEVAEVNRQISLRPKALEICQDSSGYAFISYRRADFPRIEPILEALNAAKIPFWFDRGILGGEQWMSVLQEKIFNARYFLFFLSKSAAESRYVQMEIHFAHAVGKPLIIPIRLEKVDVKTLPGGLGMMLGLRNMIPADQAIIVEHIEEQARKGG